MRPTSTSAFTKKRITRRTPGHPVFPVLLAFLALSASGAAAQVEPAPGAAAAAPEPPSRAALPSETGQEVEADRCDWGERLGDRNVTAVLYERGERLADDRRWREAAVAIEASAVPYPPCMEAVERLREAARFFHYADDLERARLVLISAAERAVDLAQPALAAHAYLDAADLAQQMDDPAAGVLPIAAALELARSRTLSAAERADIARRLYLEGSGPVTNGEPAEVRRGS